MLPDEDLDAPNKNDSVIWLGPSISWISAEIIPQLAVMQESATTINLACIFISLTRGNVLPMFRRKSRATDNCLVFAVTELPKKQTTMPQWHGELPMAQEVSNRLDPGELCAKSMCR